MESLLRGVLVLFVLSLGAERLAAVFKRRDWQPFRPRLVFGKRRKQAGNIQIDLRTGEAYVDSKPMLPVALGGTEADRLTRAANSENTLFIGLVLALLTGANAFLGSCGWPGASELRFAFVAQVLLTGAASAVGASFWHELLNLLTEARYALAARSDTSSASPAPLLPGTPVVAPVQAPALPTVGASAPGGLEQLRAAAQRMLPELQKLEGVKQVRLVDAPRRWPTHPCLEFRVELEPGAPPPPGEIKVSVGGVEHAIPVTR